MTTIDNLKEKLSYYKEQLEESEKYRELKYNT